jgi:hypothetical protein
MRANWPYVHCIAGVVAALVLSASAAGIDATHGSWRGASIAGTPRENSLRGRPSWGSASWEL